MPEHPAKRPRLLRILVPLLWLLSLGLALEVFGAWRQRIWEARGHALTAYADEAHLAREQQVWQAYGREFIEVGTDLELRRQFQDWDEETRKDFAREHGQLIVLCGPQGMVTRSYVDESHPELAALAARIAPGEPVWAMLGAVEAADARETVRLTATSGAFQNREYPSALPGAPGYIAQYYFWPYPDAPAEEQLAVFVRDSMWAVLWERFRPGVHQNDIYDFRTNQLGWRDQEITLPKLPGTVRIVCIGGSTTAEGPTNHLTYPKILETMLRRDFGTDRIEVVNAGVWALATDQQVALMDDYLALEPDLLVHYNFINDVVYRLPPFLAPGLPPWRMHNARWLARQTRFGYFFLNARLLPPQPALKTFLDAAVFDSLQRLHARAGEAGVPLAVCSFAYPRVADLDAGAHAYYDRCINNMHWGRVIDARAYAQLTRVYNAMLKRWCRANGLSYVPVAEAMTGGRETFSDICHMTLPGIEWKAAVLAENLRPWVESALAAQQGPKIPDSD